MCGLAGVLGAPVDDPGRLEQAFAALHARGPDAHGLHLGRLGDHPVTLLHTRLAIIDLGPQADQPFLAPADGSGTALAYNGEIYNYREVRADLERRGHRFRTASDTEVLVQAYAEWGDACVDRLEGMWAFALLDQRRERLLLSRDRFGEKPLYLARDGGAVWFASSVAALTALRGRPPEPDLDQVARYLVNGYKSLYKRPRTWYRDIEEVPAATTLVFTAPDRSEAQRYWSLAYEPVPMTYDAAVGGVRERLFPAVESRLRADVPIAFCLSGGVDSTTLASIAVRRFDQRIHTFSIIDGDPRYNESESIAAVVADLDCDHHEVHTSTDGFLERLSHLVADRSAPVATLSHYVHSFLSEAIATHGYKVAISGTAADELFTGYYDHYAFWLAHMHDDPDFPQLLEDWREGYGTVVRNPVLQDPLAFWRDPDRRDHIFLHADVFASLLRRPFSEPFEETRYSDDLLHNRMLNELFHEAVPVILKEDDANSMLFSVENRSPFLDRRLAEFMYTVPDELLVRNGCAKWLLRAATEGTLIDEIRLDRRKRGFNVSIDSLLDRSDPDVVANLLDDGPIFDLVDRERMARFVTGDMTDNSFSKFLFSFVSARTFLDQVVAA